MLEGLDDLAEGREELVEGRREEVVRHLSLLCSCNGMPAVDNFYVPSAQNKMSVNASNLKEKNLIAISFIATSAKARSALWATAEFGG